MSNKRFADRRFSQLNDERCWHVRERSPSRCDRSFCGFFGHFLRVVLPKGRSRNCLRARMRERGWGVMRRCVGGNSAFQPHSMGGVRGGRGGTHTGTRTGTYTQMLHLPFSDLPLKKCPTFPHKIQCPSNGWGCNIWMANAHGRANISRHSIAKIGNACWQAAC